MRRARSKSLGVLQTTRYVIEKSKYVTVDIQRLRAVCSGLRDKVSLPAWNYEYHFFDSTERTTNYALIVDSLNFCFWPQPRWSIEYLGEALDGYWALAAALKRAIEEGSPLLDASYLADIRAEDVEYILRGENQIPLLEQRVKHLREVGQVLNEHYEGLFANAIASVKQDAVRLVRTIVDRFPSFRDEAVYEGESILFFKRAQILVADLHWMFHGQPYGRFHNMRELTAFADYRLPQILNDMGILRYEQSLAERINNAYQINAGSEEEVEIRAATIWAVEWMRQEWEMLGIHLSSFEIDSFLWAEAKNLRLVTPHHRTLTVFY